MWRMTPSSMRRTRDTSSSVPGVAGEVEQVVAPVALVVDLVRELAPAPDVVQVPGAAAVLDELARTRDDLALTIVVELGVEQQQNLVLVHVPVLLPSV